MNDAINGEAKCILRIDIQSTRGVICGVLNIALIIGAPAVVHRHDVPFREPCMGFRRERCAQYSFFDQFARTGEARESQLVHKPNACNEKTVVRNAPDIAATRVPDGIGGNAAAN